MEHSSCRQVSGTRHFSSSSRDNKLFEQPQSHIPALKHFCSSKQIIRSLISTCHALLMVHTLSFYDDHFSWSVLKKIIPAGERCVAPLASSELSPLVHIIDVAKRMSLTSYLFHHSRSSVSDVGHQGPTKTFSKMVPRP